jgi:uracil phosphoribosyltransferase
MATSCSLVLEQLKVEFKYIYTQDSLQFKTVKFHQAKSKAIEEILDNCIDEFYRGHVTEVKTTLKDDGKTVIITDPMLATGSSMVLVYKALLKQGNPAKVIIASAIAAPEAIAFIRKNIPENVAIYVGAIDDELTAQSYIVPGLGDAGDLAYGEKA